MRRFFLTRLMLPLLVILITSLAIFVPAAKADTCSWTQLIDFTVSNGGWAATVVDGVDGAVYSGGVGWTSQTPQGCGYGASACVYDYFHYDLPYLDVSTEILTWKVYWDAPSGYTGSANGAFGGQTFAFTSGLGSSTYTASGSGTASGSQLAIGVSLVYSPAYKVTKFFFTGSGVNPFTGESTEMDCEHTIEDGTLIRPLSSTDEDPDFGTIDGNADESHIEDYFSALLSYAVAPTGDFTGFKNIVTAVSDNPNANVYAAMNGTVVGSPLRLNNCGNVDSGDYCTVFAPAEPGDTLYDTWKIHDTGDVWLVILQVTDDFQLQYIVRDADQFVAPNGTVHAGCILGKTVPIEPIGEAPGASLASKEVALLTLADTAENEIDELLSKLTIEPDPAAACNADPRFADCLASNPQFLLSGDGWRTIGTVNFAIGGVGGAEIAPGAVIYQTVSLDPESNYSLNTIVLPGADGDVELWIGSDHETFPVTVATYQTIELAAAMPEGGVSEGIFEIGIRNLTSGILRISHLCVVGEDHSTTPGVCYFQNPAFDVGSSYWTTDGFADIGYLLLADGQTASQPVNLDAGDYRIKVTMSIDPGNFISPPEDGTSAKLQYKFPDADSYVDIATVSTSDPPYRYLDFQTEFTLTDDVDDVMTFKSVALTGPGGILINELCLEPITGSFPPKPGEGPIVEPPFKTACQLVIRPAYDAPVQVWIEYQWNKLSQFFMCTLMVFLNQFYGAVTSALNTMLMLARWFMVTVRTAVTWIGHDIIPWLNGNFANIASGRTTTVIQDSGGCHDVFCLLQSVITTVLQPVISSIQSIVNLLLSILSQVFNLALDIFTAIVSLIFTILDQIVNLFSQFIGFFAGLLAAFGNSQPVPIPGVPACELDPRSNGLCMGLWALENTVFSGEGALAIPLVIGYLSLELILWAVNVFRSTIQKGAEQL